MIFIIKWVRWSKPKKGGGRPSQTPGFLMGRTRYSEEERNKIITNFIRCTREIIDLEGVEQVSIRKVAQAAGFNSATLYLYFQDADELITLASMSYLENYCRTLAADIQHMEDPYQIYLHTWKVFCLHAFSRPTVFYHLFYHPHSKPLEETVARYYQIYPMQLSGASGPVRDMLLAGTLEERNRKILCSLGERGYFPGEQMELINDLTICYFRKLLEESCGQEGTLVQQEKTQQLLGAIHFMIPQP